MQKFGLASLLFISMFSFANTAYSTGISDNFRLSILGGITHGGDKVGRVKYLDGSTNNLDAGAFGYFGGGIEYDINDDFIVQLNAQYHWDTAAASNGDMTFSRFELEAIPYYRLNERFRLGLGVGLHANVHLSSDFTNNVRGDVGDVEYDNATAIIGSVGYNLENSDSWVEFRLVNVEYIVNKVGGKDYIALPVDGNHFGLSYHWVF